MIDLSTVSGLDLRLDPERLALLFGPGLIHRSAEERHLEDVRPMLEDPHADGPDHLYSIYMDIGRAEDLPALTAQGLLYGAVVYNHGAVGRERLRSQGHIHSADARSGLRFSEAYEFWTGHGYVYLQRECGPAVSRAVLVPVGPGDKIVVPSGWVHLVVTLGDELLSFGAWCARDNQLEYGALRDIGGPAYFVQADGSVALNERYTSVVPLERATTADFPGFGIPRDQPIYRSWLETPDLFDFLPNPELGREAWAGL